MAGMIIKHGHEVSRTKYMGTATWDDVPHLTPQQKDDLFESIPPWQREARTAGVPTIGSGAIYPVPDSDIMCDPFPIPPWWGRSFALDVGWNKTACVWGTSNPENGVGYIYDVYGRGQAEPEIHTQAIKSRGDWIPGCVDPASRGRAQKDGEQLFTNYTNLGLTLCRANNAVEAGLVLTWQLLSSGRLKVFKGLEDWYREKRLYRRDENGNVVKKDDHFMDCTRYWVMTGRDIALVQPMAHVLGTKTRMATTDYDPMEGM